MRRQSVNILEPCAPQRACRGCHRAQEVGVRIRNFLGKRDCSITIGGDYGRTGNMRRTGTLKIQNSFGTYFFYVAFF